MKFNKEKREKMTLSLHRLKNAVVNTHLSALQENTPSGTDFVYNTAAANILERFIDCIMGQIALRVQTEISPSNFINICERIKTQLCAIANTNETMLLHMFVWGIEPNAFYDRPHMPNSSGIQVSPINSHSSPSSASMFAKKLPVDPIVTTHAQRIGLTN